MGHTIINTVSTEMKNILSSLRRHRKDIIWGKLLYYGIFVQVGIFYGFWVFFTQAKLMTLITGYPIGAITALGASVGTHRLWSHRTFKANLPLRILLMFLQSCCKQYSIYEWVLNHRLHHKYSDTDADPHNALRGYFFTHLGWMMVKKNDVVMEKLKSLDISDIEADPVVMFQKKYFHIWSILCCYVILPMIPWYFWGESPWISFVVFGVLRQCVILHFVLTINSFAHKFGRKPYDRYIEPTDNLGVAIVTMGEGWHNFHHVFPWDYRTSELGGYTFCMATHFINFMAKIGWATDLKAVSMDLVMKRKQRTGDGTASGGDIGNLWGWGDTDMDATEKKDIEIFNKIKES